MTSVVLGAEGREEAEWPSAASLGKIVVNSDLGYDGAYSAKSIGMTESRSPHRQVLRLSVQTNPVQLVPVLAAGMIGFKWGIKPTLAQHALGTCGRMRRSKNDCYCCIPVRGRPSGCKCLSLKVTGCACQTKPPPRLCLALCHSTCCQAVDVRPVQWMTYLPLAPAVLRGHLCTQCTHSAKVWYHQTFTAKVPRSGPLLGSYDPPAPHSPPDCRSRLCNPRCVPAKPNRPAGITLCTDCDPLCPCRLISGIEYGLPD